MTEPVANIHPNAKLGENVKVEPFATIYEDVEIDDDRHLDRSQCHSHARNAYWKKL